MKKQKMNSCVGLFAGILLVAAFNQSAHALNNGLALTPPMGWNSWNGFGCNINETLIKSMADAMVNSGMAAAGYQFVNMDDCWAASSRDANGNLVANSSFPGGIKALADYVHSKGLKLGIYESRGTLMCSGTAPGSQGYEVKDANTFASWGVDYLKYDNCYASLSDSVQYTTMCNALLASGRPIVFSLCRWSFLPWMPAVGNLWRTTMDINANWASITSKVDQNVAYATYAKPGAWNDPDMLEVGLGLTTAENRAHFSLWAIMAAPLIAGCDLRNMTTTVDSILTNPEVIAVDQDSLGKQGVPINNDTMLQVWRKPMRDSSIVVLLVDRGDTPATISFTLASVGITQTATASARDLWLHTDNQIVDSFSTLVQPHDVVMLRLVAGPDKTPPRIQSVITYPDSSRTIAVVYSEPVDPASAGTASNYGISPAVSITSATLQSDRQTVILALSAMLDTGVSYTLTVHNIADLSGNVLSSATATFKFVNFKPITTIRYYPRTGWESRMDGGVFEGTISDKDSGPYLPLYTISLSPPSGTWSQTTILSNTNTPFRYVRYRSPDNGFCNVAEVEFYTASGKLSGTPFGTPGSWNNSGNDYTKVFDGDVTSFFDAPTANGAYAGLDLGTTYATAIKSPGKLNPGSAHNQAFVVSASGRSAEFSVGSSGAIKVFDMCGNLIARIRASNAPGIYHWTARSTGIYFIRFESPSRIETRRIIIR